MTRLAVLPHHEPPPLPLTPQQVELQGIRLRISGIAALLSRRPERIRWACERLQEELDRLRGLDTGDGQ